MGSEAIPVFLAITARQNLQIVDMTVTVGQNIFGITEGRTDEQTDQAFYYNRLRLALAITLRHKGVEKIGGVTFLFSLRQR